MTTDSVSKTSQEPQAPKDNGPHLLHSTSITGVADIVQEELSPCKNVAPRGPYTDSLSNFCSASAGARILFATDDWFAAAENLLKDGPPIFDPDAFCEQGKVMDGWETRRRREEGHDWCIIRLSSRADIRALELDTAHFTGNHVPKVSIEIADLSSTELSNIAKNLPNSFDRILHGGVQGTGHSPFEVRQALETVKCVDWKELLPVTPLAPGYEPTRMHYYSLNSGVVGNVIRLNYFPDGGVARLRVWGSSLGEVKSATKPLYMPIETGEICSVVPHASTDSPPSRNLYHFEELSSLDLGGKGIACSNKHYGEPWRLLQKALGKDMGDGWETARHPNRPSVLIKDPKTHLIDSPLMDWAVLKLGREAKEGVARIIIDTRHFRGNYPESIMLEGCYDRGEALNNTGWFPSSNDASWFPLISRTRMSPDSEHVFDRSKDQVHNSTRPVTHVRLSIFPDGGISRVRVYG